MATSGSFYTNVGSGWRLQMEWELNSQSIENNTSSITARLYWMSLGSPYTVSSSATKTCGIQYNDGSWDNYSAAGLAALSGNQKKLIHSKTFTINHNADGTSSFSLDGYFKAEVTLSGTYYGTVDLAQKSYTLPTIPRASTPSLSASSINMNSAVTIYTNRASTSFTHTLSYVFGSASGTIATGVGASYSWTVPLSLANQIPNATSGFSTITCKTYSGGTLIGTKTINLILMVPSDIIPSVSISNTGVSLYNGYYVQNKSKVAVSLTDSGAYGSTISSRKTTVNGATYTSAAFTTGVLTSSGTNTISTTVTDSRGRTKTVSTTISVTAYSNPQATNLTAIRSNSDGSTNPQGAYMKLTGSAVISSINSTNTKNTYIRYRPTGGSWTTAVSNTASYTPSLSAVVAADINSTFEVELITADYYTSASRSTSVSTAFVLMDFHESGTSMAIGKVAEGNGVLDVGGDIYASGDINVTGSGRVNKAPLRYDLSNQVQTGDYRKSVIALCNLTNSDPSANSWSIGTLTFHRSDGLSGTYTVDISIEKRYNTTQPNVSIMRRGVNEGVKPCTFQYNGIKYGGVEIYISDAAYDFVEYYGSGNFDIFGLDYDSNGVTLNSEVKNSINTTSDINFTGNLYFQDNSVFHTGNDFRGIGVGTGKTTSTSVPNSTSVTVIYNTVYHNHGGGVFSTNTSNGRITVNRAGYYLLVGCVSLTSGTTDKRINLQFTKNSDTYISQSVAQVGGDIVRVTGGLPLTGSSGDYFTMEVWQNSGVSKTMNSGVNNVFFNMIFLRDL